jgi:excisionase family DNA binding protein
MRQKLLGQPLHKPRDVAEALGYETQTVYRKIRKKEIRAVTLGSRTVRIPHDEYCRLRGELVEA